MGCEVLRGADFAEVRGPVGRLRGVDVDMNDMPDAALAIAVVALFAGGPTQLANVANLRIKETDRLRALETELRKLGAGATATADSAHASSPARLHGAEIDTYDDHRMAMSFALAGLRIPGVVDPRPRVREEDLAGLLRDAGAAVGISRAPGSARNPAPRRGGITTRAGTRPGPGSSRASRR